MAVTTYHYLFLINILLLQLQSGLVFVVSAQTNETNYENRTSSHHSNKHSHLVNIGLILDLNSSMGVMAQFCITTALSDFYSAYPHSNTRLVIHPKNSDNVLAAASAALDLLNNTEVAAIIGPQTSEEAKFVIELGEKAQVPILSFSVRGSSLSPSMTPYFIRTAVSDSSQLQAITAMTQGFQWNAVVVIYQDSEYANGFISSLTDAFQEANIQLPHMSAISTSSEDSHIRKELKKLLSMQTRVFLVHMLSPSLASRLFSLAEKANMMSQGNVWIVTDGLSNSLNSMDATIIESMEGVVGVRPYVPNSKNRENLEIRWEKFFLLTQTNATKISELNIFGLWAYDTVWALAAAAEAIQPADSSSISKDIEKDASGITNLKISKIGPKLLEEILGTKFRGVSGEFKLEKGELETPAYEIINLVGNGQRPVGYWTSTGGLTRKLYSAKDHGHAYSTSTKKLKTIIWPGDSTIKPKGWDIPGMGDKLRVGVPKKYGFMEFVDAQLINDTKQYHVTGFSVDVFTAALKSLPFKIEAEFIPFVNSSGGSNGSYDDLVQTLQAERRIYDVVVGDTTIRAHREEMAEFSLPYSESGVVMVVKVEPDKLKNMWIFLMPLRWDLWLTTAIACILVGLVIRILERHENPQQQLGMLVWFPLAALAFPERNLVANNWARFVLVVWLFMAYILMQSYTANLSSILTVGQLSPSLQNISCAGHQDGSFVAKMLENMNFTNIKTYSTMKDYDDALSKGCKHGGVDAIFDEIPYIKLFLHKYGSKYRMVGRTYMTAGFGFVFPYGSPLVSHMSEAILKVMESGEIQDIEKKYFGNQYLNYQDEVGDASRSGSPSLTAYSFAGLFTITGFFVIVALVCSECSSFLKRRHNRQNNLSRVHSIELVTPENDLSIPKDSPDDDEDDNVQVDREDDDDDAQGDQQEPINDNDSDNIVHSSSIES